MKNLLFALYIIFGSPACRHNRSDLKKETESVKHDPHRIEGGNLPSCVPYAYSLFFNSHICYP